MTTVLSGIFKTLLANLFCLSLFLTSVSLSLADTFTVNSLNDEIDILPGNGRCRSATGHCTLRAAIMEANALTGLDAIEVPRGNFSLSLTGSGEDDSELGDLDISESVTITGANANRTYIHAQWADRVFHVLRSAEEVTLSNFQITGGSTTEHGGGIRHEGGTLNLDRLHILQNQAVGTRAFGGGIYDSGEVLNIDNCRIAANTAISSSDYAAGGGVYSTSELNLDQYNRVEYNWAYSSRGNAFGGGVYSTGDGSELDDAILRGNILIAESGHAYGAGAYITGNDVNIRQSKFSENSIAASGQVAGGGLYLLGDGMDLREVKVSENDIYSSGFNASGGGIFSSGEELDLFEVLIHSNTVETDSGNAYGGGLYVQGGAYEFYKLRVTDNTVSASSTSSGGGIASVGSTGVIEKSLIARNSITSSGSVYGAGIYSTGSSTTFEEIEISLNIGVSGGDWYAYGGGVYSQGESLMISRASISGNTLRSGYWAYGGGIYNYDSTYLAQVTISGNQAIATESYATASGGGIYNFFYDSDPTWSAVGYSPYELEYDSSTHAATLWALSSTIAFNEVKGVAGSAKAGGGIFNMEYNRRLELTSTILAKNTADDGTDCLGTVVLNGFNLVGDAADCDWESDNPYDQVGDSSSGSGRVYDPLLNPLANNGGSTRTHSLQSGSPAIDAGGSHAEDYFNRELETDQRGSGYERDLDGDADGSRDCDVGAYEYSRG